VLTDGGWIYVEARAGIYDRRGSNLDLAGRVTVHHDDGTQFVTDAAKVDLAAGGAAGDAPVAAQGPFGTLTAEGFRLRDRGQVGRLHWPVAGRAGRCPRGGRGAGPEPAR
jgi:lipopolysaccharide export system protein LptC